MEKNRLSISFVGVFDNTLPQLPQLDNEFCQNLFQMPSETTCGYYADGLIIRTNNNPTPIVLIGPQKMMILAYDEKSLYHIISCLDIKFSEIGFTAKFNSFGINYEYEWKNLNENSNSWMWNHFITSKIDIKSQYKVCNKLSFRLGINENESLNFEVEPRIGIANGLYASINHHHNMPIKFLPPQDILSDSIKNSESLVTEYAFQLLSE